MGKETRAGFVNCTAPRKEGVYQTARVGVHLRQNQKTDILSV